MRETAEEAAHPLRLPIPELYKFSTPDSIDNIVLDKDEVLRAGTQEKLVERLTFHKIPQPNFTKYFLITFRSFMKLEQTLPSSPPEKFSSHLIDLLSESNEVFKETSEPKVEKVLLKSPTHNLLDMLIERYNIPEPFDNADANISTGFDPAVSRKRFLKNYCIPVQTR